ncbi:PQQ-binding-like beta-propeller repeat protein [Blastopirellula sp. J2-11]|uniref:outer membrane protein assembly factor BamB family protein n=1 Tax=Blastopirellula sp. J2-11 TaxID=2943192 RepID=UPI0021C9B076|nr:PQQ-binding-like beta-propeller repeat protein [Blastopirellula sp. J2-11]UUO04714.1 PQQ-binding-like beta-propeller repeat protein [Blastopirellula sp. J2-11]
MKTISPIIALLTLVSFAAGQDSWPQFRAGGSSYVGGPLPLTWSPQTGIAWQRELEGYGQSTPIIHNQRVFVTSTAGPNKETCVVSCIDIDTGGQLWRYRFPAASTAPSSYMMARAAPTPVVDDLGVYLFFESGDVAAIDPTGALRWRRDLAADFGPLENNHGIGASPAQTDQCVILNVEHRGPSYLIAIDKQTGETRWKTDRPSSNSWSSPIVIHGQIIISSNGAVAAYDADSGESLWTVGQLDGNSVASPTPDGDRLYVGARVSEFSSGGDAQRSNLCIQCKANSPQIIWRAKKAVSDYASPVVCGECVYYLNNVGVVYCLDKMTGRQHYAKRIGTDCWATPIVSQDRIYFWGKDGQTTVLKSGPQFEQLASNLLWDLQSPPPPETYVENVSSGKSRGFESLLETGDANGDGFLTIEEVSGRFRSMFPSSDINQDGRLDADELRSAAKLLAARRSESQNNARDPIVYGAAAITGRIVIRTGTRLYCISQPSSPSLVKEPVKK